MTEYNALARPYATAAFEYAMAEKTLDKWQQGLTCLAQCVNNDKIKAALQLPKSTPDAAGGILLALCDGYLDASMVNFIKLLAAHERLMVLPSIATLFDGLRHSQQKTLHIDVTTTFSMTGDQQSALEAALVRYFEKNIAVDYHVDPTILGGVVVKAGDKVIDASFAGQLQQLTAALVA